MNQVFINSLKRNWRSRRHPVGDQKVNILARPIIEAKLEISGEELIFEASRRGGRYGLPPWLENSKPTILPWRVRRYCQPALCLNSNARAR
jgi:hypothetical protein